MMEFSREALFKNRLIVAVIATSLVGVPIVVLADAPAGWLQRQEAQKPKRVKRPAAAPRTRTPARPETRAVQAMPAQPTWTPPPVSAVPEVADGTGSGAAAEGTTGTGTAMIASSEIGNARVCEVVVDRSQREGSFDVTLQEAADGKCLCHVYTGPVSQDESVEAKIARIQKERKCPDGVLMAVAGPANVAGRGFFPVLFAPLAAAAGLGVAAASNSGTPANPVSP